MSDRWVGAGIDETVSSQASKVLPVGNPAALRRVAIEERLPAGELLGEQGPDRFGGFPALRLGGGQHVGGVAAHVRAGAAGATGRRPRRSSGAVVRSSPEAFPGGGAVLERVVLAGAVAFAGGVRGEDRGEVAVGEPAERGGVPERPVDPFGAVQAGQLRPRRPS